MIFFVFRTYSFLVPLWALTTASPPDDDLPRIIDYCIIGAGPAGLQLGHFFLHVGWDYVIFERASTVGSFFRHFPRHRRLISLNKRHVRPHDATAEFAFRHDWNSLLDVRWGNETNMVPPRRWSSRGEDVGTRSANSTGAPVAPMTSRSRDLYPLADRLVEYLEDFSQEQRKHIRFRHSVKKVSRVSAPRRVAHDAYEKRKTLFELEVKVKTSPDVDASDVGGEQSASARKKSHAGTILATKTFLCGTLIVAAGFTRPKSGLDKVVDGVGYVTRYDELPSSSESFEGKSVCSMGMRKIQIIFAEQMLVGRTMHGSVYGVCINVLDLWRGDVFISQRVDISRECCDENEPCSRDGRRSDGHTQHICCHCVGNRQRGARDGGLFDKAYIRCSGSVAEGGFSFSVVQHDTTRFFTTYFLREEMSD